MSPQVLGGKTLFPSGFRQIAMRLTQKIALAECGFFTKCGIVFCIYLVIQMEYLYLKDISEEYSVAILALPTLERKKATVR